MAKVLSHSLVKHLVKGLWSFTGQGPVVSVKDNLTVNIDRCIHTDKTSKHDNGANFYFHIYKCRLFKMGYLVGQRNPYLVADD